METLRCAGIRVNTSVAFSQFGNVIIWKFGNETAGPGVQRKKREKEKKVKEKLNYSSLIHDYRFTTHKKKALQLESFLYLIKVNYILGFAPG